MLAETDPEAYWQDVRDVIQALSDQTIVITLFTADLPYVVGPRVSSWTPTPGDKDMNSLETVTPA
jgi:hypothetical protein